MSMGSNNFGDENMCIYETDQVFTSVNELVDWAIARGRENGYVLVRRRSKTNAAGFVIKVWLKCDHGGVYKGEPKVRRTGSKKSGCEFELIGKYERSCGGWKLRVVNSEHNHQGAEQLGSHPYVMRLNESETRLVEQLSNQNMLPRDILAAVKDQNPDNVSNLRSIYNARRKLRVGHNTGVEPQGEQQPPDQPPPDQHHVVVHQPWLHPADAAILCEHATRLDCMEDMTRWMVEHMAATSGVHVPVFPRQRHDYDPHDPGGHV